MKGAVAATAGWSSGPVSLASGEEQSRGEPLYTRPANTQSRSVSFENPAGGKGAGGRENQGAKGHFAESLKSGETKTLLDIRGSGIINRFWIAPSRRSADMLRSIRLDMYWDGAKTPAVSAPLGDFFGMSHGRLVGYETDFFSCPEKRAFNCFIPMPFLNAARITLTNDSETLLPFFIYEISIQEQQLDPANTLYFHAAWRRERRTTQKKDFEFLPRVAGTGRFLGANVGVIENPVYEGTWWGEGEAKIYLDGDTHYATLVGTGSEDYTGTSWGMSYCNHRWQGCLVADKAEGLWSFYRYHIPDPIFFYKDIRVTMQQIGGGGKAKLQKIVERGTPLEIVAVFKGKIGESIKALEQKPPLLLEDPSIDPADWCNYFRSDDWCATAYFYLDRPESGLQPLASRTERVAGIPIEDATKRVDQ
jgi:hypothetical protein